MITLVIDTVLTAFYAKKNTKKPKKATLFSSIKDKFKAPKINVSLFGKEDTCDEKSGWSSLLLSPLLSAPLLLSSLQIKIFPWILLPFLSSYPHFLSYPYPLLSSIVLYLSLSLSSSLINSLHAVVSRTYTHKPRSLFAVCNTERKKYYYFIFSYYFILFHTSYYFILFHVILYYLYYFIFLTFILSMLQYT
jgi:hypothetical protein